MTGADDETLGFEALLRNAFGSEDLASEPPLRHPPQRVVEIVPGDLLAGRYRVVEEIGRGGVGVVYRANDSVLRRAVAVKVLDARHRARPALLDRFFEEAQVGAQLEHPGIVPVHDVGLAADGRPFFVMKLLDGQPLAALLLAGPRDTGRWIEVFEQVCRAVAHAHDHGVVHRDLKPSNIVVGELGDVQVLDWGMAKVLARSAAEPRADGEATAPGPVRTVRTDDGSTASVTGSVFGTPAYMAPEQARGEIDVLDERSDVFALGAILCEILTGSTPWTGSRSEIRARARGGDTREALAALDSAEVEDDLRSIARDCLEVDPGARPSNGREVAERVAEHRRAAAERARRAEVRAATAETRSAAERRARRWQLATASAILVLAGLWIVSERRAADRRLRTAREVDTALREVARRRGEPGAWTAVEAALQRARAAAASGDADADTLARIDASETALARELARAQAERARRARDQETVARLSAIEERLAFDFGWGRADRDLTALFEGLGVVVGSARSSAALAESTILPQLVRGLDTWAACRANAGGQAPGPAPRVIRELASAVDPDPLRARVRSVLAESDPDATRALVAELARARPSPDTAILAADALHRIGAREDAKSLLREVFLRHPDHGMLAFRLWQAHAFEGGDPDEAFRYLTAAVSANPDGLYAGTNLGTELAERGRVEEAVVVFERVRALHPDAPRVTYNLGLACWESGRIEQAEVLIREALRELPGDVASFGQFADLLERAGRVDDVLALLADAVAGGTGVAEFEERIAWLEYRRGHCDAARAAALRCLEVESDRGTAEFVLGLACSELGDREGAIAAYRAAGRTPGLWQPLYNLGLLLEERAESRAEARDAFRAAAAMARDAWEPRHELARMLFADGEHAAASELLRQIVSNSSRPADEGTRIGSWIAIARCARALGRTQEELEATTALTELRPDDWTFHAGRAGVADRLGEHAIAEAAWRRTVELAPDQPDAWLELGRCLHAQGRSVAAAAALEQAIELRPDHARAWAWLGRARLDAGLSAEAAAALGRARELDAADPDPELPIDEWLAECARRRQQQR